MDAGADSGEAAQLAPGEDVDEEVADGLEVPGRDRGYLGVTGAGEGGAGRAPGAWAALPGEVAACFQAGGDVGEPGQRRRDGCRQRAHPHGPAGLSGQQGQHHVLEEGQAGVALQLRVQQAGNLIIIMAIHDPLRTRRPEPSA